MLAGAVFAADKQEPDLKAAGAVNISAGWRFRADPRNAGLKARWDGISFNDGKWTLTGTGADWPVPAVNQDPPAGGDAKIVGGRVGSDAAALPAVFWFRKWVELPESWPRILVVLPSGSRADIFVNGTHGKHGLPIAKAADGFGAGGFAGTGGSAGDAGAGIAVRDITTLVAGRTRFLLALRVSPAGDDPGFGPVLLARDPRPLLPGDGAWFDYLAGQYPRQPWPSWLRGLPCGWVTTGVPTEPPWTSKAGPAQTSFAPWTVTAAGKPAPAPQGIFGIRGQIVPDGGRFAVSCWLYDPGAGTFHAPEAIACTTSLTDRFLPLPAASARAGRFNLYLRLWPHEFGAATGTGREPSSSTTNADSGVDGKEGSATTGSAVPIGEQGSRAQQEVALGERSSPKGKAVSGFAPGAGIPAGTRGEQGSPNASLAGTLIGIGEVTVQNITDQTLDADLFVAVHGFGPAPGILRVGTVGYDRACQAILADGRPAVLLSGAPDGFGATGFAEPGTVARFCAAGKLPPEQEAVDPAGMASGAAVYRLKIQPYGDRTQTFRVFLAGAPATVTPESALAIREIGRKSSFTESRRAWQRILGSREVPMVRVPDMRAQDAFYASLAHIGVAVSRGFPAAASPEVAAALLRAGLGSSVWDSGTDDGLALPPAPALAAELPPVPKPLEALASGKFDLPPVRDGTFRPAEGLALALSALGAGDPAPAVKMLGWCLAHSPAPGCFAWAEAMDRTDFGWAGGDLPDARAAALYVCLLRDMILREEGDGLLLTSGLPEEWIRPGCRVEVRQAPTRFGRLPGASLLCSPKGMMMRLLPPSVSRRGGRRTAVEPEPPYAPAGGIRWRVPGSRKIRSATVNGVRLREVPADRTILLPPGKAVAAVSW